MGRVARGVIPAPRRKASSRSVLLLDHAAAGPAFAANASHSASAASATRAAIALVRVEHHLVCGPVVAPGDPGGSLLIGKLTGSELCTGTQMPKGDPPLAENLIDTISNWICQGAGDN